MKIAFQILALFLMSNITIGQVILTGEYNSGLKLAFDDKTNKMTGYFEMYSGWDTGTSPPNFSCIFYMEGLAKDNKFEIITYYPEFKSTDTIVGSFEIINNKSFKIKLPVEHGGCWNVQHFADEPVLFELENHIPWSQIRYVAAEKAYFYSEKSDDLKKNSYIVKNDFVCIDRLDGDWAYCSYYGKKVTLGWIKIADLNKL